MDLETVDINPNSLLSEECNSVESHSYCFWERVLDHTLKAEVMLGFTYAVLNRHYWCLFDDEPVYGFAFDK